MDMLKKFFPFSWKYTKDVPNLIIGIILHIIGGILVGALITLSTFLTAWIPVVGGIIAWLLGIISSLVGVYILVGIVLQILVFAKVLKD